MRTDYFLAAAVLAIFTSTGHAQPAGPYQAAHRRLVQEAIIDAGIKDERVIDAIRNTARHEFVPRHLRELAYEDMALPIGDRQTISSPFIVAFMTEALEAEPTDKVLEIGTGSGYQAAVLSPLVKDVYSIEIVESLGRSAKRTLERLEYDNVHTRVGDGFKGWPEHAPFDKIIVTCSPESVPKPLVEQLREGGLLVVPVGERYQQTLYVMRKRDGRLKTEALRPTLFVPMTGQAEVARREKPDPLNPQIANGTFEKEPFDSGFIPDWYYQRQLSWATDEQAPEGKHYVTCTNEQPGRQSHALQGFAVDGRRVTHLEVSAHVRYNDVRRGRSMDDMAAIVVTFYDQNRKELGHLWLGTFQGTADWHLKSRVVRVPPTAREGLLRIGLFGAVGEISFDDVKLKGHGRLP
jgi:protein-L-isoaspartate(D-aspartate) O-methyltransferase